jgi:hypothetical protein
MHMKFTFSLTRKSVRLQATKTRWNPVIKSTIKTGSIRFKNGGPHLQGCRTSHRVCIQNIYNHRKDLETG